MEKINTKLQINIDCLIYGSLIALSIGLVTSTTILALSHILMIIPIMFFFSKVNYKNYNKSSWALLFMALVIIISIITNQDIAVNSYKPIGKIKYFLLGFLMIAPYAFYFNKVINKKKSGYLIFLFCIATTVAGVAGIVGMNTGYNYISMRPVNHDRNAGLSGMVLNYAHNLAYFQVILLGLIIYHEQIENIINKKILYIVFTFNLIALYLSYTRGAILSLIIAAPFFLFKKNRLKFITIGAITLLLTFGAYYLIGSNILRPSSDKERISQWRAAIKAFEERPYLGYGYLNFEQHSVPIKKRYNIGELQFGGHAHNNFLEMLASTGIIGFTSYIIWLVLWFIEIYKRNDIVSKISLPLFVAFIISGLTQSTISLGVNLFFIMGAYAIFQATSDQKEMIN